MGGWQWVCGNGWLAMGGWQWVAGDGWLAMGGWGRASASPQIPTPWGLADARPQPPTVGSDLIHKLRFCPGDQLPGGSLTLDPSHPVLTVFLSQI